MVYELTDPPLGEGNRAKRKELSRERLSRAGIGTKIIKCADIIDNMHSICTYDPKFARTFLFEVGELLPILNPEPWSKNSLYTELLEKYAYFNPLSMAEQEGKKKW